MRTHRWMPSVELPIPPVVPLLLAITITLSFLSVASSPSAASAAGQVAAPTVVASSDPATARLTARTTWRDVEIVGMRERYARTFATPAGALKAVVSPNPINYQASNRTWQPIDSRLVSAEVAGYGWRNAANRYRLLLPRWLSDASVELADGNSWLRFQLTGAERVGATVDGAVASYRGALTGVTVRYAAMPDGVKEEFVLAGPGSPSTFTFEVAASPGLALAGSGNGGLLARRGTEVVFELPAPFMTDSSGGADGYSGKVSYALVKTAGGWRVTLRADRAWLADPARAWPVTIDPTVTITGPGVNADCHIVGGSFTTSNFCSEPELEIGSHSTGARRGLLNFSVGVIPAGARILDAQLRVYVPRPGSSGDFTAAVHRVTNPWTNAATWIKRDATTNWTTAGGDYASEVASTLLGATAGWEQLAVTSIVSGWVDGTFANRGLLLRRRVEGTSNFLARLVSRNNTDSAHWPNLVVTYATAPTAPTNVTATAGDAQATVNWTPPASDGGSAITGYTVTASPGGATATTTGATTASVGGLTNGTSYTFTVRATNNVGPGPPSAPSNAVTPQPPPAPGTPTDVVATPSDGKAIVHWLAPSSGGAVSSYWVTATPGGATATVDGATTSATVAGLANGTSYTFTVIAINASGQGPLSVPSGAVTPRQLAATLIPTPRPDAPFPPAGGFLYASNARDLAGTPDNDLSGGSTTATQLAVEKERASRLRHALVKARRQRGNLPVGEQLQSVAQEARLSTVAARQAGHVVVTLADPIPYDIYRRNPKAIGGPLATHAYRVTFHIELSDGYPFAASGRATEDVADRLRNFMKQTASQARTDAWRLPHGSAKTRGLEFAARIDQAVADFDQLAVILGVTVPLRSYGTVVTAIGRTYRISAAEVELSPFATPFKDLEGPLDAVHVDKLREVYRAR